MSDFTAMSFEDLLARSEELSARAEMIEEEIRAEGADVSALAAESDENITERQAIARELENRKAAKQAAEEARAAEFAAAAKNIEPKGESKMEEKRFAIDSVEYRDAWVKNLINRPLDEEERAALTASAAVIPQMTVNEVWDKLVKPAELLGKVDVSQFPNYVRFPKATTVNAAAGQAIGTTITVASDVLGYVDLVPNEYVKLLTVKSDIANMAIPAVHDWIVNNLVDTIRYAINKDILVGTGTNSLKGITASVNASATALTAAGVTKADCLKIMAALPAVHHAGAIWIMTPELFYGEVMAATQLNDYIINNGFETKLFGHDVVLMSEALVSSKETIFFGDPKAYKCNIFKALEVKQFETATTTNLQFRGDTLADGELLDTTAFVRFAKT